MLAPGGRIVLSHVQGGNFVKDECRRNPSIAIRIMPNDRISLLMMADELGMRLVEKNELLRKVTTYDESVDGNDGQFYLVALEKKAL